MTRRRYHLRFVGFVYIALAVLVGVAAANRPNNLLVWVFGVMLSAVLLSGIVSGLMMLGIRVTRLDPRHGRVGEPLLLRYAITNRSRLVPAFNLNVTEHFDRGDESPGRSDRRRRSAAKTEAVADADAWIMHAGPGETVHGEAVVWPRRRGPIRFDRLEVWSSFPFGLIRKSIEFSQPQETLIHPRVHRLRPELLRSIAMTGSGGMRSNRRLGDGLDFYGTREYRSGDSVRQIAWKRGAGLDQLVVVERTQPSPPRLRVVLNLLRPTGELRLDPDDHRHARDLEEDAISLAASLLANAESAGYEVALTVLGLDVPPLPLRRGYRHLQRLMAALAGLDLDQPRLPRDSAATADFERAAMVVVSPDRSDPRLAGSADASALLLTARQLSDLVIDSTEGVGVPGVTGDGGAEGARAGQQGAARTRESAA